MGLPFTSDQFFGLFADYNRAFWPVAVVLWIASGVALAGAWRDPPGQSRALTHVVGALRLWSAVAYHALLFTRINPVAWVFAALFAVEAALFSRAATRRNVEYCSPSARLRRVGQALACYGLAHPFLNLALGHRYPAMPTFGVPCPTALLTIGVLLTARGGVPLTLAIIPAIWGFVGGSAAMLLTVRSDYVLLGAGALLTGVLVTAWFRTPGRY
jgi:hypothetical protein